MRFVSRFPLLSQRALASRSFSRDPLADIWIQIDQRNAGRLAPSEKIDAVPAGQSHILEVENNVTVRPFQTDERFQLRNMLFVNPAT